ncbi:MAG TPA: permease-like cell division protein FtsX [Chloroflexota bacterium]|nr:permease-like cell division protein FtsX [Chloroflexota bacterium]
MRHHDDSNGRRGSIHKLTRPITVAGLSILRHRGASGVAVATLAFMLTALILFIALANGVSTAASGLESKANLIADLNSSVSRHSALELGSLIQDRWPRTRVTYIDRAQALVQFKKTFAGNSAMLSALDGNPLPASLNIHTADGRTLSRIAASLRTNPEVRHLIFNPDLTKKLVQINTFVRVIGIVLILGLAFLATVIVVNTTHLTVQAREEEIEIMRLIGASSGFVRNPFIVEGIMLGLVGSLVATMVGAFLSLPLLKAILAGTGSAAASLLPINTSPEFLGLLALVVLLTGASVGATGSYISVRRFARL